jgi:hypothetical protein
VNHHHPKKVDTWVSIARINKSKETNQR